jgi:hypothetical protein
VEFYDAGALLTSFDIAPPAPPPITFTLQMSQISPGTHVYTAKVFRQQLAGLPRIAAECTVPWSTAKNRRNPPVVSRTSPPQPTRLSISRRPKRQTLSADVTPGYERGACRVESLQWLEPVIAEP